jgi:hypothetical protein
MIIGIGFVTRVLYIGLFGDINEEDRHESGRQPHVPIDRLPAPDMVEN